MLMGKLILNVVLEQLWQYITVDFITKLLWSKNFDSILVVYDQLLKMLYFVVITEKTLVKELVRLFRDNV